MATGDHPTDDPTVAVPTHPDPSSDATTHHAAASDTPSGERKVFAYQILTPFVKSEDLDPACLVLDNSANERADWYEYWPIRRFLLKESLDENAYYAFLSPRFKEKTNLRVTTAIDVVKAQANGVDVVLFSPSLQLTAYHWNVFEYGEACHPGLMALAGKCLARIGYLTDLKALISHSGNEVYSNYFFAKPRFWREWLLVVDQLMAIAESPTDPLGVDLRKPTSYRGVTKAQMKVFILERVPTWLLARDSRFVAAIRDPFATGSRIYKLPGALVCDALKMAYAERGAGSAYKDVFVFVSMLGKTISRLMRLGYALRLPAVRDLLDSLKLLWNRAGRRS